MKTFAVYFFLYAFLCLPTIVHLIVDRKGKVNHKLNAVYVLALSILVGLFLYEFTGYWWQGSIYALCIHFALFDPIYNLMHGKSFFYHGSSTNPDQALTDKLWNYLAPHYEIFIRLWFLLFGYGVFYYQTLSLWG